MVSVDVKHHVYYCNCSERKQKHTETVEKELLGWLVSLFNAELFPKRHCSRGAIPPELGEEGDDT